MRVVFTLSMAQSDAAAPAVIEQAISKLYRLLSPARKLNFFRVWDKRKSSTTPVETTATTVVENEPKTELSSKELVKAQQDPYTDIDLVAALTSKPQAQSDTSSCTPKVKRKSAWISEAHWRLLQTLKRPSVSGNSTDLISKGSHSSQSNSEDLDVFPRQVDLSTGSGMSISVPVQVTVVEPLEQSFQKSEPPSFAPLKQSLLKHEPPDSMPPDQSLLEHEPPDFVDHGQPSSEKEPPDCVPHQHFSLGSKSTGSTPHGKLPSDTTDFYLGDRIPFDAPILHQQLLPSPAVSCTLSCVARVRKKPPCLSAHHRHLLQIWNKPDYSGSIRVP